MSFPNEKMVQRARGTRPDKRARASLGRRGRGSFGSLAGVPIRIHLTLIALIAWIALSTMVSGVGPHATLAGVGLVALVLGSLAVHEIAHTIVARRHGVGTREVVLLPIGGVARVELAPDEDPDDALAIAVAGPMASLAIATACGLLLLLARTGPGALVTSSLDRTVLPAVILVNAAIGLFNLIAAFPMDGARALRAALARRFGRLDATPRILVRASMIIAIALALGALFVSIWLLALALFVWFGARHEEDVMFLDRAIASVPVDAAMNRHVTIVTPDDRLDAVVDRFRADPEAVAVVIDHGMLVGVVTPDQLASYAAAA